jgi:DtxR family Mn-dependent transcriptional regulator
LLELYLAKTLELELDAVHAEADRLEHALSENLEARIDEASALRPMTRTAIRFPT